MPHLVPFTIDDPPGANDGYYCVLDLMTDLEMAPQMGVWRLLENDARVNPVHAALLHTGSVLFFAGSGNDMERHAALQYASAVWHYPRAEYSQPPTPVSQLNVLPETYADGAGWSRTVDSPSNWPQYCHLFVLADGRVFYSGGQYGANNGVRPSIWDLATNTATDVQGVLVDAGRRNQSASVLLPPAQDQRVMVIGGGPPDMHDMTGATNTTAITDLSVPAPTVTTAAPMAMRRMHLCATLLPDRTVLVNGGAMMEESGADATLDAEIYHPDAARWPRRLGDGCDVTGGPVVSLGGAADA